MPSMSDSDHSEDKPTKEKPTVRKSQILDEIVQVYASI